MAQNPFIKFLKQPKQDRPLLELTMTAGEQVVDAAIAGHVLEAVPFVDYAFKALKAKDSIADAMFRNKLVLFVNGIGQLSNEELRKAKNEFLKDEGKKAGETLLLVLDRITDLDKPELLGFLFKQFVNGRLTPEQLRRLTVAVDVGFGDDLRDLLDPNLQAAGERTEDCRRRLVPTGLTFLHVAVGLDVAGQMSYHFTALGRLLYELVHKVAPIDEIEWPPTAWVRG